MLAEIATQVKPYSIPRYKIALVREKTLRWPSLQLLSSLESAKIFRAYLGKDIATEHFLLAMLDTKNDLIGILTISTGSLSASVVHPRHVFQPPIFHNAAGILVAHNHPSGNPQPSREDITLTIRLTDCGDLLGITLLDHIILGDGNQSYYSFAENGMLKGK